MNRKIILLVTNVFLLSIFVTKGQSYSFTPVWEIGKKNNSASEFALYSDSYTAYPQLFKEGVAIYTIGKSKEKEIPYFLHGSDDAWAGNVSGRLMIRFGVDQFRPDAILRLKINLVETHPTSSPLLKIMLNDHTIEIKTPVGYNRDFLSDKQTRSEGLSVEVEFPAGTPQKGDNLLIIENVKGSWLAFDNIVLLADKPLTMAETKHAIDFLNAYAIPALKYGKGEELEIPVKIEVANWSDKVQYVEVKAGNNTGQFAVNSGIQTVDFSLPEVKSEQEVDMQLISNQKVVGGKSVKLSPVKKWMVYLIQHTHTDIGYTRPQTEILREHLRYIDYAIEYCELTEDLPDDARFRWTCEASWTVNEYLKNRPQEQINKLKRYVDNGQIEITGMFFNMSEIVDENSLKTFLQPLALLKKYDIPVTTAMQNDVNGIAWCLADYFPDLGVEYLWMGQHGHRALIPFDKPTLFKWESPSGKQMLAFRADHYMTGNSLGVDQGSLTTLEPRLFNYLEGLNRKAYPFDAIAIQYSGYSTDNSPPSFSTSKLVEEWNKTYAYPKLRNGLPHEFMDDVAAHHLDNLKSYRVAYPDWWTDGFGSAARETGASRRSHADMVTIESLLSIAAVKGKNLPSHISNEITHIHENLLFYDEHTFGASESLRDPLAENSQEQWSQKSSFVWEGLKSAQLLYETAGGLLQGELKRGEHPTITFFNPNGHPRTNLVTTYIDYEVIPENSLFAITDAEGNRLKVQQLHSRREGRFYAILAEEIPAMGYKTFDIVIEDEERASPRRTSMVDNVIENSHYRITLNPETGGISSIFDKELRREMVDADSPWDMGAFIYEKLDNRHQMEQYRTDDYTRTGLSEVRLTSGVNGEIYQSVHVLGKAPGVDEGYGVRVEIKLFNNEKRIELSYALKRLPELDPTAIYVAFPFLLNDSRLAFDVHGGVVYPGENQLEGTASDWNTVQNFVAARNDQVQYILGSDAVPLVQLGDLLDGPFQYRKSYEKPHLFSWVMNNYWVTNFRASQEGEFRWNYCITSTDDLSNVAAINFTRNSRIPVYARIMPVGKENNMPVDFSAFAIDKSNLLMTSCTLSEDPGWLLLNVRETDGKDTALTISDRSGKPFMFQIVNAIEEPLSDLVTSDRFKADENKFIKLKIEQ
ncbi:MAG: hypothetical protein ITG04_10745 [Proteiniphilum sp.]|nr:hypothetical protein [Proteiniphilum sp.]